MRGAALVDFGPRARRLITFSYVACGARLSFVVWLRLAYRPSLSSVRIGLEAFRSLEDRAIPVLAGCLAKALCKVFV